MKKKTSDEILRYAGMEWLWDLNVGIDLSEDGWQKKKEQVDSLPKWAYEPSDVVKKILDGTEKITDQNAPDLWAHLKKDVVCFCSHYAQVIDRDTRRIRTGGLTAAQKVLAWRVAYTVAAGKSVKLALLKQRRGGFSFIFSQITYWVVGFRKHFGAIQLANDVQPATELLRYLSTTWENFPEKIRPTQKYSAKRLIAFEETDKEKRAAGQYGLKSRIQVSSIGTKHVGSGGDIQVVHAAELGKWDGLCDPEVQWTSLVNTLPEDGTTFEFAESTAHGAETFWHRFWKDARKIGSAGWNMFCPVFIPWYFDDRNKSRCPVNVEWGNDDEDEFGNEQEEMEKYGLTAEQMWWRRIYISKQRTQVPGLRNVDIFRQEFPGTAAEAWLHSAGRFLRADMVKDLYERAARKARPIFIGDITPRRAKGRALKMANFTTATQGGPLKIWSKPKRKTAYVIGGDVAQGMLGGDHSCLKVRERRTLNLAAEWYGHIEPDRLADIMWRLGHWYNMALLNWERTGSGLGVAKFLRKSSECPWLYDPYPASRMYRRPNVTHSNLRPDSAFGTDTQSKNKKYLLANWLMAVREGMDVSTEDVDEAASLTVDDRDRIDTGGADRFMADVMTVTADLHARTLDMGEEEQEAAEPEQGSVAASVSSWERYKEEREDWELY